MVAEPTAPFVKVDESPATIVVELLAVEAVPVDRVALASRVAVVRRVAGSADPTVTG